MQKPAGLTNVDADSIPSKLVGAWVRSLAKNKDHSHNSASDLVKRHSKVCGMHASACLLAISMMLVSA